eukprot:jgi/Psemu1/28144/gm1.28144_g
MENKTEPAYKRTILPPWFPFLSAEYNKRMHELNHGNLNNYLNPFFNHFETGFDALCAQNGHLVLTILEGCKQVDDVRTRLNSKNGQFDKDEALEIWEECLNYVSNELFLDYGEDNTDNIDHVWDMEDIKCYNNVGIEPEVQSGEQERLEMDGKAVHKTMYTFKPWEPSLSDNDGGDYSKTKSFCVKFIHYSFQSKQANTSKRTLSTMARARGRSRLRSSNEPPVNNGPPVNDGPPGENLPPADLGFTPAQMEFIWTMMETIQAPAVASKVQEAITCATGIGGIPGYTDESALTTTEVVFREILESLRLNWATANELFQNGYCGTDSLRNLEESSVKFLVNGINKTKQKNCLDPKQVYVGRVFGDRLKHHLMHSGNNNCTHNTENVVVCLSKWRTGDCFCANQGHKMTDGEITPTVSVQDHE